MLQEGVSPDFAEDSENMTLLYIAVSFNAIDIAHLLLSAGANLHSRLAMGGPTPIELAESLNSPCLLLFQHYIRAQSFLTHQVNSADYPN